VDRSLCKQMNNRMNDPMRKRMIVYCVFVSKETARSPSLLFSSKQDDDDDDDDRSSIVISFSFSLCNIEKEKEKKNEKQKSS